ncbi:MAG: hypothetical protein KBC43_11150 [Bacteroidales bacterium]|nr:hypothetical protein [Bacteroidales bacterium]
MITQQSILTHLKPQYFWDVDRSALDSEKYCRLIIQRVFTLGEVKEMNLLISYYGKDKVIEELCTLPYIDPKTLNFVSRFFQIPLKSFRCHRVKQSTPQFWNS